MTTSRRLSELLQDLVDVTPSQDCTITGISIDSRTVEPGHLFVAMPGVSVDGRLFVDAALNAGAIAVLADDAKSDALPVSGANVFMLTDVRGHLGLILNRFYDFPSSKMTVIGITGTNGKTTCSQLIGRVLDRPGQRCAIIGTLGSGYPDALDAGIHTTPDIVSLYRMLAGFVADGAKAVCMEVSSHALEQERVAGVSFDIAVFTNLTRDHLDYHGSMENYAQAKTRLFAVEGLEFAVINLDDAFGRELAKSVPGAELIGYGFNVGDIRAEDIDATPDGMAITLVAGDEHGRAQTQLYGEFNVSNLLAVAGVLKALGWRVEDIAHAFGQLHPVAGRMEHFPGKAGDPVVVVDYAHTPDALEQALKALRPHTRGLLWCVFGCGGNRDSGKRPLMGAVAEKLADRVVLTDDNPRDEMPMRIIEDIEAGMQQPHRVIQPREQAIRQSIGAASADDLVLLAGKGHEDYQEIAGQRYHFSDRELVREILGEAA